jgi:hypothetical protein
VGATERGDSDNDFGELLERWAQRMVADLDPREHLPEAAHGLVLRAPADPGAIAATEARLGVKLTGSYRRFLELSNGAFASSLGPETGSSPDHGFLPVEELQLAALAEPDFVDLWADEGIPDGPVPDDQPVEVQNFAPLREGVLISGRLGTFIDVLVPIGGDTEWQVWTFFKEGASAYRATRRLKQPDAAGG